jgi:hypothetical protein
MGREEDQLGPSEFWDGAMGSPLVRKVKVLKVVENAVFTSLVMQFPATPATTGAANPNALTFPAFFELRDVKSFQLASGSVQAIYAYGLPDPPP